MPGLLITFLHDGNTADRHSCNDSQLHWGYLVGSVKISEGAGSGAVTITANDGSSHTGTSTSFYLTTLGGTPTLSLASSSVPEGSGTVTGTITLPFAAPANLTVELASSDTTEATVPATITIPSGATSATFSINVIDDALFDGSQTSALALSLWAMRPHRRRCSP